MPLRSQSSLDWWHGLCSTSGTWHACWKNLKRGESPGARDASLGRSVELMKRGVVEKGVHARLGRMLVLIPLLAFLGLGALFVLRVGVDDPSRILSALFVHADTRSYLALLYVIEF